MTIIEVISEEKIPQQVAQLEEVIQQLQQRIVDLELCTMPETPQEIRDLREAIACSKVGRMKDLALECKQLSSRSAQTYETLTETQNCKHWSHNSKKQRSMQIYYKHS
jgi:hypothetical protein